MHLQKGKKILIYLFLFLIVGSVNNIALTKINFVWDMIEQKWKDNYEELKKYFEKKGHSSVVRSEGFLGAWCNTQRIRYKKGKLTKEKIDLLEKIEFKWKLKKLTNKN